jgi:hypothetical protein
MHHIKMTEWLSLVRCNNRACVSLSNHHSGSAWCALERHPSSGAIPTRNPKPALALRLLSFIKPLKAMYPLAASYTPTLNPGELIIRTRFAGPAQPILFRMDSPDLEVLEWLVPDSDSTHGDAMQLPNGLSNMTAELNA